MGGFLSLLSPGVSLSEIDLTTVLTGAATTGGVLAGPFVWGPAYERTLVDSELTEVAKFGKPDVRTANTFFTGAKFLQYGNNLNIVRALSAAARNSAVVGNGVSAVEITFPGLGYAHVPTLAVTGGGGTGATLTAVVDNGEIVNVIIEDPGIGYTSVPTITVTPNVSDTTVTLATLVAAIGIQIKNDTDYEFNYGSGQGHVGEFAGKFAGALGNGIQVFINDDATEFLTWPYANLFQGPPGTSDYAANKGGSNDELHVVVIDNLGLISGTPGSLLEKYQFVSKASDAMDAQGTSIYYATAINRGSAYIRWMDHPDTTTLWGSTAINTNFDKVFEPGVKATKLVGSGVSGITFTAAAAGVAGNSITLAFVNPGTNSAPLSITVAGTAITVHLATDVSAVATSTAAQVTAAVTSSVPASALLTAVLVAAGSGLVTAAASTPLTGGTDPVSFVRILEGGFDGNDSLTDGNIIDAYELFNVEEFDFALLLTSDHSATVVEHCITEIAESRGDCLVVLSPPQAAVVNNPGHEHTDCVTYRNTLPSSSYATMDANWIRTYDKYNDLNRYIPSNGDVAGLCVRTDQTRDPWFSPAGLNRGNIKGAIGLAWNPKEAFRNVLYQANINPIVSFPGQGAVLFGDKTLLTKPSAFDRINVRRLFIIIEKAVAAAAKYTLFEFNDDVTRTQFRALIDPFLRDIQGRRGLFDYLVVCDASNNSNQTIDQNGFQGDIYLQPNKSINFIKLNFVATNTGVDFSTVQGTF